MHAYGLNPVGHLRDSEVVLIGETLSRTVEH